MKTRLFVAILFFLATTNLSLYAQENSDFELQQCYANKGNKQFYGFEYPINNEFLMTRDPNLYLSNLDELDSSWIVIDVSEEAEIIPGALKLPLHAVKHKAYLKDQKIVLIGNGRAYSRLEQQAHWLEEYVAAKVKVFNGSPLLWRFFNGEPVHLDVQTITAGEYFGESSKGQWRFINTESELRTTLLSMPKFSLNERFIILGKQLVIPRNNISPEMVRTWFVLEGGEQELDNFLLEQGIILTAKKEREQNEECSNIK
ncbi:hypothetical protein I6M45_19725 [Shewanella algae]|uniref:hypothetical protein n=1 Tax=Shewanella algae TaxID=38313 RepID=UPI0011A4CBC3|nr:hypothetical protein [Shewanella algae]MBO2647313.1 hypothetical protein [Shewanella algae]MCE9775887.1 hypothetical protein [Shewanella algae]TWO82939.1 hypothetical protein AYI75_18015 [Shewanella algae]